MFQIIAITMPTWGMSMTEGKVVAWLKKVGDAINKGDELVEIETTKLTGVTEAFEGGVILRKIIAKVDETLPCGALLAVAAEASVPDSEIEAFASSYRVEDIAQAGDGGVSEKQMTIEGVTLNAIIAGKANDGKTPLLLVHGFGGDANNWSLTLTALSDKRPVVAIDLPGHGKSSKTFSPATPETIAALLAKAMAELGYAAYHMAGHSYGALVAGMMAGKNRLAVKALVLVDPAGVSASGTSSYVKDFVSTQDRKGLKGVMEQLVENTDLISRSMVAEVLDHRRLEGVQVTLEALGNDLEARTGKFGALPADVAARTLVIWGEKDKIFSVAQMETLPAALTKVVATGVGHMPHIEWKDFNKTLAAFIAKQD